MDPTETLVPSLELQPSKEQKIDTPTLKQGKRKKKDTAY